MAKSFMLYGFEGSNEAYRVSRYEFVAGEDFTVSYVKKMARWMVAKMPSIREVYMMDNRRNLASEYKETLKKNSMESFVIFRDTVQFEGVRIL